MLQNKQISWMIKLNVSNILNFVKAWHVSKERSSSSKVIKTENEAGNSKQIKTFIWTCKIRTTTLKVGVAIATYEPCAVTGCNEKHKVNSQACESRLDFKILKLCVVQLKITLHILITSMIKIFIKIHHSDKWTLTTREDNKPSFIK